jgi:hypothetical protein
MALLPEDDEWKKYSIEEKISSLPLVTENCKLHKWG